MKWAFYVIVFVYMFYRAVYGVKEKEIPSLSLDVQDVEDGVFIKVGDRRVINCKATSRNQKVEWINPNGQVVSRLQSSRVYATQYFVPSMRSTGPSLVLTFSHASVDDTGDWECRSGDIVQNVSVCVMDPTEFEGTQDEIAADEGRSFTLSCQAKGVPEPSISWSRNGEDISEDYSDAAKYRMTTKYNSQGIEGLLTIMSLSAGDSGVYTCEATQESALAKHCSSKESFNITLNINQAPEFEQEDAKEKVYGKESETLFLKCEADGYPLPRYQWFRKDDAGLTEYSIKEIIHPDNGSSILQVKVAEDTYDNQYICRASNILGVKEMLFIILEPTIPEAPSQVCESHRCGCGMMVEENGHRMIEYSEMCGMTFSLSLHKQYYSEDFDPVISTAFTDDAILFNITWDEEILFDINDVEVQYLPYAQLGKKRAASPKESDWKGVKRVPASIGDIGDRSVVVALNGLEDDTKYWVRLRVKNEVGASPWSHAIKARTQENLDNEFEEPKIEDVKEEEKEGNEETTDELVINYTENVEPATSEVPEASDDSGNFYGLFFAAGVLIVAVGCTFVVRMV